MDYSENAEQFQRALFNSELNGLEAFPVFPKQF